ncbi:MAG: 4-alpha-glucanotransferase [Sedimentibacter sp.]|uniref:4-alpha-glucanotransferase n=1 Tax=Sedimentibacter sp. TaxID=1960295 RepID=UPI0029827141|nr:4-alpha-glucanotransferase [Sedimentibacter sp.]MDW5299032.1 4-alpha-glucanotransferase [Sedimentibacter sp.]
MLKIGSGIFLPISSLPSKYGIGTFGKEAYEFVKLLHKSGQKYWQILPIGPVSYGDSPYSSFSSFAGNPYFIDLEMLIEEGLISEEDCFSLNLADDIEYIDYEKQFYKRYDVLRKAYKNAPASYERKIYDFKIKNEWVNDYALFMALKYKNNQLPWYKWDADTAGRNREIIEKAKYELKEEIDFWIFLQFKFYIQYFDFKKYAGEKGVSIIGDIPIYAAMDSVDVWCNLNIFMFDENYKPSLVAGVPPDAFSAEGQLWGNPVYNWEYLRKTNFRWWIERIKFSLNLYDAVRIDHFRGFDEFYAVDYGSLNAVNGKWMKAYGSELFLAVKEHLGNVNVIAEDLGIITESVLNLKESTGFPGMKVLQFAFDGNPLNPYLPSNYENNCVAYTGTHDNDTLKGWFEKLENDKKQFVLNVLGIKGDIFNGTNDIMWEIIKSIYSSKASLCIVPLQDFLCLGSSARINTPSTLGNNWAWRVRKELLTNSLADKIKEITVSSSRENK